MDVKKRFKLYKSGKRWVALALLFGGTAFFIETNQTVANADESVAQTSVQSEPDNSLQGQTDTILQEKAGTSIMFRNTATSSFGERRAIAEAADISWSCLLPDPMQNASRLAVITGTKIRIRFMVPEVKPFRSLITSGITARTTICTTMSTDLMTWEEAKNFAPRLKEVGKNHSSNWKTGWFAINSKSSGFFAYARQLNAMMEITQNSLAINLTESVACRFSRRCICQNHCRLRTNRWKWAFCP